MILVCLIAIFAVGGICFFLGVGMGSIWQVEKLKNELKKKRSDKDHII